MSNAHGTRAARGAAGASAVTSLALVFHACAALLSPGAAQGIPLRALTVEDVIGLRNVGGRHPVRLSADGRLAAYAVQDPARVAETSETLGFFSGTTPSGVPWGFTGYDVWVTDVRTGEATRISGGGGTGWGPVWSPDGDRLAFYSDRSGVVGLWVWERRGGDARQVGRVMPSPSYEFQTVQWSPDGTRLILRAFPEGTTFDVEEPGDRPSDRARREAPRVRVFETRGDETAAPNAAAAVHEEERVDLVLVAVRGGTSRVLATEGDIRGYWFSPDGSRVAYTRSQLDGRSPTAYGPMMDLVVVSLDSGERTVVAPEIYLGYGISVRWSPDGAWLAYLTNVPRTPEGHVSTAAVLTPEERGDLFVVGPDGAALRLLTPGEHVPFGTKYGAPVWTPDSRSMYVLGGSSLWRVDLNGDAPEEVVTLAGHEPHGILGPAGSSGYWSPDGGASMMLFARDTATHQARLLRVKLEAGAVERVRSDDAIYGTAGFTFDVSADGATAVMTRQDARRPYDIWSLDADGESRRLTNVNPSLDAVALGPTRMVQWTDADGRKLRGALLLPPDYRQGTRVPMIVWVYASMRGSQQINRFGLWSNDTYNLQMFASRGYAVFWPDIPMRGKGMPMEDVAVAVLPGVDRVIEMGIADPDRLGVMGQSGGGYTTLSMVVQTNRFKAAVMAAGFGNLTSFAGMMSPRGTTSWQSYLTGTLGMPWPPSSHTEAYVANSPLFFLDRVTAPLMIQAGGADTSVQDFASEEVYIGLKNLGKEAVYLNYPTADHVVTSPENLRDFWARVIDWFEKHFEKPVS